MSDTDTRLDVTVAALLYLITAYRRTQCPGLAACIARHFHYLSIHPRAHRVLSEVAAASRVEWESAAREAPASTSRSAWRGLVH